MLSEQTVDTHQQYPWITSMPERFVCSNYELTLDCVWAYAWMKTVNPKCLLDRRTPMEIEHLDASQFPSYAVWIGDPNSRNLSAFRDLEIFINYIGRFAIPHIVYDEVLLDVMNYNITQVMSEKGQGTMMEEVTTASIFLEQEAGNFEFQPEDPYAGEFSYRSDEAFQRCAEIPMKCIKVLLDCNTHFVKIDRIVLTATGERDDGIVILPQPVLLTRHHYEMMMDEKKEWVIDPLRLPRKGVKLLPVYPTANQKPRYMNSKYRQTMVDMVERDDRVIRADPHFAWFQCDTVDDAIGFAQHIDETLK